MRFELKLGVAWYNSQLEQFGGSETAQLEGFSLDELDFDTLARSVHVPYGYGHTPIAAEEEDEGEGGAVRRGSVFGRPS